MTARIATCLSDIISRETLANTVSGRRCFLYGLVFRFRLLSTPSLDGAVAFSYGQTSVSVR